MKKTLMTTAILMMATPALAGGYTTGETVKNMTVTDSNGVVHNLDDFKGQNVILEWTNHGCPYVKRHYDSGNMQGLQQMAEANDMVWLSVISSAPGKQGHVSGEKANELTTSRDASPTAVVLDEEGVAGRAFDAKTTPHMYIINADQTLVYQGAIDDDPRGNADAPKNYVTQALVEMGLGDPVSEDTTQPYGCSVKYAS